MASSKPLILSARVVLPVGRAPIDSGAVAVVDGRIAAVGKATSIRRQFSGPVQDLGEVMLLPGLVNAHCHLDYTHMAGLIPPQKRFCDWIKLITTEKAQWSYSDYAESWIAGARMLLNSGTTTVGDVEAVPELLPEVWDATPLRVLSFLEMTGVKSRRKPNLILQEAIGKIESLKHRRCAAALSPHAPYSTPPALLRQAALAARRRKWRVTTHVAESATEFEMFTQARGEMYDWLKRNDRDMADCGSGTPTQQLANQNALGPHLLAVHGNYLTDGDITLFARSKTHVVHCPRSHDYFKHAEFPYAALQRAAVNVCLGTDSLATVWKQPKQVVELSLFQEMRKFRAEHPNVSPKDVLRMTTQNPAHALGLRGKVGELSTGANADLIALPFAGRPAEACDAATQSNGDITASMIGGAWAIAPK